ncbi:MAG: hypothetical protein O3B24_07230 [Verrucomicrobia bacterium]|nr:hypothetical protein [Verrucomicrobiota bacterium]
MHTRGLILRAVIILAAFAIAHVCGGRACTSVLSGTSPLAGGHATLAAFLGVTYIVTYLGCTVVAPILLIAAAFLALADRWFGRANNTPPAQGKHHAHDHT